MKESVQVGMKELREESLASPEAGPSVGAGARPGGSPGIKEELEAEAEESDDDAAASQLVDDEISRIQGQDLNNEVDEEVKDIQAPLKFINLLNNHNHYELRNIFMNLNLTEEEKQDLIK